MEVPVQKQQEQLLPDSKNDQTKDDKMNSKM